MKFCEKLIILRKRRGLTQEEFAREVGVSRQSVYKWESGKSYPEAAKLMEIRRLYGVSVDELLDENEELLLSEKSERPALEVPPAPAPIYEFGEVKDERETRSYTPLPVSAPKEEALQESEGAQQQKAENERPVSHTEAQPARPRVSVLEPYGRKKQKKQNTLLELVGSIFGRKR